MLRAAKELDPELPVIVMTAFGSIQDAVAAMKEGALDFLAKPVDPDHLLLMVERALAQRRLATENILLKEELAARRGAPQIVGEDPGLKQVTVALHRAAATDATVLLEGESGTGKELFARALHALSPRADGPFVAINCAAIPENLLETELFGHEKGAFTGAAARKPGKFELAHRGTLFLDEIGDLPLPLQAKILRALEEKRFERVGGTAPAAGRRPGRRGHEPEPEGRRRGAAVPRGSLLPALGLSRSPFRRCASARTTSRCSRKYFIERFCRDLNKKPLTLAPSAVDALAAYPWPGNVRELQNCIERAVILTEGDTIHARHLSLSFQRRVAPVATTARGTQIDLSGTLAEVVAARDRRGRAAEDRAGAEGGGRQPGPRGRDPAGRLQGAAREAARVRPDVAATRLNPTRFERRPHLLLGRRRPRWPCRRWPSAARSAAVRRPSSCRAASPRSSAPPDRSAIGGQRAQAGDEIGAAPCGRARRVRRARRRARAATSMP